MNPFIYDLCKRPKFKNQFRKSYERHVNKWSVPHALWQVPAELDVSTKEPLLTMQHLPSFSKASDVPTEAKNDTKQHLC